MSASTTTTRHDYDDDMVHGTVTKKGGLKRKAGEPGNEYVNFGPPLSEELLPEGDDRAGVVVERDSSSTENEEEERPAPAGSRRRCTGNIAFECPKGWHIDNRCREGSLRWHLIRRLMKRSFHLKKRNDRSLQEVVKLTQWKMPIKEGLRMIKSAKLVVRV